MKSAVTIAALATLLVACTASAAVISFGPRLGYTHDDAFDQLHFGGQAWLLDVLPAPLVVVPSAELGLGDDVTFLAINGDVVYEFTEFAENQWSFYAGAGLALNRADADAFDSTEFGLNALGGATYKLSATQTAFGELRLGLEDSPDIKLTFGINFF